MAETRLDLAGGGERLLIRRQQQRRAHERLAELGEQQARHRMIGNAYTDGAPPLVLQTTRCGARRAQQERVGTRQARSQHAELPGLEAREATDLREAGAYQREMVVAVR